MSASDLSGANGTAPAPDVALRAVVVVPAHDEAQRIEACLRALADQQGLRAEQYEVVLVLDCCRDATRATARRVAAELPRLRLTVLECDVKGAGHARRIGMDFACARLRAVGRLDGLLASTDADSRVARDWLAAQLMLVDAGAQAIGGRIDLDPSEIAALAPAVADARGRRADARLATVRALDGALTADGATSRHERVDGIVEHHHFAGASLGLTLRTYLQIGGLPVTEALEDEALARALQEAGVRIHRPDRVRVTTSARTNGRASRGLAHDLALADWRARRSFRHDEFTVTQLLELKNASITVILPAR
ncbi:MAG: glucosyl-3-phosphoglycerate synthase, partial [bacterium]